MARLLQEQGKNMARTWQEHDQNIMAITWQESRVCIAVLGLLFVQGEGSVARQEHGKNMARAWPWSCHVFAMLLIWSCHGLAMLLPWFWHALAMLLTCSGHALAMRWPCFCHALVSVRQEHGNNMGRARQDHDKSTVSMVVVGVGVEEQGKNMARACQETWQYHCITWHGKNMAARSWHDLGMDGFAMFLQYYSCHTIARVLPWMVLPCSCHALPFDMIWPCPCLALDLHLPRSCHWKSKARTWQEHGKNMEEHGKNMARAWHEHGMGLPCSSPVIDMILPWSCHGIARLLP
jgi:hypothetical protein